MNYSENNSKFYRYVYLANILSTSLLRPFDNLLNMSAEPIEKIQIFNMLGKELTKDNHSVIHRGVATNVYGMDIKIIKVKKDISDTYFIQMLPDYLLVLYNPEWAGENIENMYEFISELLEGIDTDTTLSTESVDDAKNLIKAFAFDIITKYFSINDQDAFRKILQATDTQFELLLNNSLDKLICEYIIFGNEWNTIKNKIKIVEGIGKSK